MKYFLWLSLFSFLFVTAGCRNISKNSSTDTDTDSTTDSLTDAPVYIDADTDSDWDGAPDDVVTGDAQTVTDVASSYSTEHDPKYAITYLLTEFEQHNHHNAEGAASDEGRGYLYIFDDPNTDLDFVEPRAKKSPMCMEVDDDGNLTDELITPYPPGCAINTGYDIHGANPFEEFGSTRSFHMTGTVAGDGLGFGVNFAYYLFYARRDDNDSDKLMRDENGNIPAFFSDGRYDNDGEPLCSDDWKFASVIAAAFLDEDNRVVFDDSTGENAPGKYIATGSEYGPAGSIYSEGWIWEDANTGQEKYELKYDNTENTLLEPRCLADMKQEGFVMWATGNATVEVNLIMPDGAPISEGGICDEDAGEKCRDYHRKRFVLDGEWREYHATWDEFLQEGWGRPVVLDPNRIINVHIKVVAPENGTADFDVWLDHIGFYGGNTWPFVEQLADTDWMVEDTEFGK